MKKTHTEKWYDEESEIYDKRRFTSPIGQYINDMEVHHIIKNLKGKKVLELCCGTARYAPYVLDKGYSYTGLDFSKGMLARAKKKQFNSKIKLIQGNVNHLGRQKGRYDSIFVVRALKFFDDPQQVFNDSHKLLNKNGRLIIQFLNKSYGSMPILYFMSNRLGLRNLLNKVEAFKTQEVGSETRYSMKNVREMALKAGFKIEKEYFYFNLPVYSIFNSEFLVKIIRKIDNRFNFGYRGMLIAKK